MQSCRYLNCCAHYLISVVQVAGDGDLRVVPSDGIHDLVRGVSGIHGLHESLEADAWLVAETSVHDVRADGG